MSIFVIRRRKNIDDLGLQWELLVMRRFIVSHSQLCFHFIESSLIMSVYVFNWRLPLPSRPFPLYGIDWLFLHCSIDSFPPPLFNPFITNVKWLIIFVVREGRKWWNGIETRAHSMKVDVVNEKRDSLSRHPPLPPPLPLSLSIEPLEWQFSLSYEWKFSRRREMTFEEWDHWNPSWIESIQREENGQEKERERKSKQRRKDSHDDISTNLSTLLLHNNKS